MHDSAKHGATDLSNTCSVITDLELSFSGKERLPFRTMRDRGWVGAYRRLQSATRTPSRHQKQTVCCTYSTRRTITHQPSHHTLLR